MGPKHSTGLGIRMQGPTKGQSARAWYMYGEDDEEVIGGGACGG